MNLKIGVSEYEKPRLKYLWSLRFLFQVGLVFSWTIIAAVFVDHFGFAYLPHLLLAEALIFFIGSIFSNFLFLRTTHTKFMLGSIIGAIILVILAFLFREEVWAFFVLAIMAKNLFFAQLNIALFRRTESLFSPDEARRLMPILDSAVTVGTVFAASLFLGLLELFAVTALIIWWLVPLSIMGILVKWGPTLLSEIPKLHQSYHEEHGSLYSGIKAFSKVPFIKFMALLVVLQSALFAVVEIEFLKSVKEHATEHSMHFAAGEHLQANIFGGGLDHNFEGIYHDVEKIAHHVEDVIVDLTDSVFASNTLAHDLGELSLLFGFIALFVQFFLTSSLLKRFGVAYTLVSYFALFLLSSIALLFGAGSMNIVRGTQHGGLALFQVPYHMSFYSLSPEHREAIRHMLEGLVRPLGIFIGIMAYGAASRFIHAEIASAVVMIVLCIVILALIGPFKSFYTRLSHTNLRSDKNMSGKLQAVEVLGQRGHENGVDYLLRELKRKNIPEVAREKIIKTLTETRNPRIIHSYLEILVDESESKEIKIQLLESLNKLASLRPYWEDHVFSQHHLLKVLQDIYESTNDSHLKKLSILNIFQHLPAHQVAPFFLKTIKNAEESLVSVCLRSAAEIFHDPELSYYLRQYLHHKSPRLRGHAVISLWKFDEKGILRGILKELLDSNDREERIAGIYALGEVEDHKLESHLYPYLEHHDFGTRAHALVALAKLGNMKSIHGLLEILFQSHPEEAQKVFYMLKRAPQFIRDKLKKEIHIMVSDHVLRVLLDADVREISHLQKLSEERRNYLKWLYRLAGRYDDVLIFERS